MTTFRTRALVSLATITVLGGCAGRAPLESRVHIDALPLTIGFENDGRDQVHVYLVGERREWLLGRVEPGSRATLRIPVDALAENAGSVRLAAIAGGRATLQALRDPRAQLTISQPASAILSQHWWFSQGQLASRWLPRARR